MASERSKDAMNGPRVSKPLGSDWTSCLTYLESSTTVTRLPRSRQICKQSSCLSMLVFVIFVIVSFAPP